MMALQRNNLNMNVFPRPIAWAHSELERARESVSQFSTLFDLAEETLRYLTLVDAARYLELRDSRPDSQVEAQLRALSEPSMGDWAACLGHLERYFKEGDEVPLGVPLGEELDLSGMLALVRRVEGSGRRRASAMQFLKTLVTLRNKTKGHGAVPETTAREYVADLRAGILELLTLVPILVLKQPVYVKRIEIRKRRHYVEVERLVGTGRPSTQTIEVEDLGAIEDDRIFLWDDGASAPIMLSPLFAYADETLLLLARLNRGAPVYRSCEQGTKQHEPGDLLDIFEKRAGFLFAGTETAATGTRPSAARDTYSRVVAQASAGGVLAPNVLEMLETMRTGLGLSEIEAREVQIDLGVRDLVESWLDSRAGGHAATSVRLQGAASTTSELRAPTTVVAAGNSDAGELERQEADAPTLRGNSLALMTFTDMSGNETLLAELSAATGRGNEDARRPLIAEQAPQAGETGLPTAPDANPAPACGLEEWREVYWWSMRSGTMRILDRKSLEAIQRRHGLSAETTTELESGFRRDDSMLRQAITESLEDGQLEEYELEGLEQARLDACISAREATELLAGLLTDSTEFAGKTRVGWVQQAIEVRRAACAAQAGASLVGSGEVRGSVPEVGTSSKVRLAPEPEITAPTSMRVTGVTPLEPSDDGTGTPDPSVGKGARYQAFFQHMIGKAARLGHPPEGTPGPRNWYARALGLRGLSCGVVFNRGDRIKAELYIDNGDGQWNLAVLQALGAEREAIEAEIGGELTWEDLPSKRACRIGLSRGGSIDDPPDRLEELCEWGARQHVRFLDVFGRRLPALRSLRGASPAGSEPGSPADPVESLEVEAESVDEASSGATGTDPATHRRHVWLIAAGAGGADWTDWLSAGSMGVDFGTVDTVGDLSTVASRAAVHARVGAPGSQLGNDSLALWQFSHEMQVGDVVWAKAGRSNLLGRGEIVSEYRFCPAERYPHQRRVRWEPLAIKLVDNTLALKTLTDITENRALLREAAQGGSRQSADSVSLQAEGGSSPTQIASRLQALLGEDGSNALRLAMGIKSATGEVSAQMVNTLLDTLGFQEKHDDGSRRLTTAGRAVGVETETVSAKGQVIHAIRWRDAVLVPLAESARTMTRAHEAEDPEAGDDEDVDVESALLDFADLMTLTVGEARGCDGIDEYISALTGLTTRTIAKHLSAAAPQKRIRNLFELPDMGDVGELTSRRAIDLRMSSAIAVWTDLDVADVDRRLQAVPGQSKVRTALGHDWPSE